MAARETTYAGILGELVRLNASLTANASELQHIEGARARLDKLVTDAQEVAKRQAALTASKQEASKQLSGPAQRGSAGGDRDPEARQGALWSPVGEARGVQPAAVPRSPPAGEAGDARAASARADRLLTHSKM